MKPDTLVWAKDKSGNRYLCAMNILEDPNRVRDDEISKCIDRDDRLRSRRYVPSNDPDGKIKFAKSESLN
jgi:hypothetical protein